MLLCEIQLFKAITLGDLKTIRWYAERKASAEYSVNGAVVTAIEKQKRRIAYLESVLRENKIEF